MKLKDAGILIGQAAASSERHNARALQKKFWRNGIFPGSFYIITINCILLARSLARAASCMGRRGKTKKENESWNRQAGKQATLRTGTGEN